MQKNVSLSIINNGDITTLPEEKQKTILAIKDKMDLSYQGTLNFATEASDNLRDFSTAILESVKVKDIPEVDGLLTELMTGIDKVDANTLLETRPSFFKKIFRVNDVKNFIAKYDDVASVMVDIKEKLQSAQIQLQKDVQTCDNYIEQNLKYIDDLDNFIIAGTIKKDEVKKEIEEEQKLIDPDDQLALQTLNRKQAGLERLDRKIYNLKLLREIAIQNIPQISLIQQGDCVLIEKIQSSIDSAIPLWESQVVIAIALAKQKNGIEMQKSITAAINGMIKNNSELIKTNAIEIARQLDEGIIDIEVIQNSSQNLIETLNGVRQVQIEGSKKRETATKLLEQNQQKLCDAIVSQSNVTIGKLEG